MNYELGEVVMGIFKRYNQKIEKNIQLFFQPKKKKWKKLKSLIGVQLQKK